MNILTSRQTINTATNIDLQAAPTPRQDEIIGLVRREGYVTIEQLAESFSVTAQTIRRDVQRLADLGMLRRKHGGVEIPSALENIPYRSRKVLNLAAKETLAAAAAERIPDGASIAFSIGTTPEIVARALLDHRDLRIFTNNMNVAMTACANPTFEVTVTGGRLRNEDFDSLGAQAESFFASYKVDFGVFGVGGVDTDGSLLDFYEDEVRCRQAILANCRNAILVLDHSKFGRSAHVRGGHLSDASMLVCDIQPPADVLALLADTALDIVVAQSPEHPA